MPSQKIHTSTDYKIKELSIQNYNGTKRYSLSDIMTSVRIYEDLFNNVVSCQISILDAIGFIEHLPIISEETVRIIFEKNDTVAFDMEFRVYKISNRENIKEKVQRYTLHCVSKEMILSLSRRVSQSYEGKISDIIPKIFTEYFPNTTKPILIEPTKNIRKLVVPNKTPFETINWLCTKAIPENKSGATYVFYEDREGFKFVALETLSIQDVKDRYHYSMTDYLDGKGDDRTEVKRDFFSILSFDAESSKDVLDGYTSGTFNSTLVTVDPLRRLYTTNRFDYNNAFNSTLKVDKRAMVSTGMTIGTDSKVNVLPSNLSHDTIDYLSSKTEPYGEQFEYTTQVRQSYLSSLFNSQKFRIRIPGENRRKVGDIIFLNLHSYVPGKDGIDELYSGRYIITALCHKIEKDKYTIEAEVCRNAQPLNLG